MSETASMLIVVPGTPDASLSLNGRGAWQKRARLTRELRGTAKQAAQGVVGTGLHAPVFIGPVRVRTVIAWEPRRQTVDGDNAVALCKAVYDGLTDAGVWGDDKQCMFDPVEQRRDPDRRGYVAVEVTRAADQEAA